MAAPAPASDAAGPAPAAAPAPLPDPAPAPAPASAAPAAVEQHLVSSATTRTVADASGHVRSVSVEKVAAALAPGSAAGVAVAPRVEHRGSIALSTPTSSTSHINVARPWISWKKGNISEYVSKPRVFFDHLHQQIVLFTGSPPNKIWFSDRATQTWMDYPLHLGSSNDIIGAQFSPDRTHVALRVSDKEVKVLSTQTGEVVTARSCRGTSSRMVSVHWLSDPSLSKTAAASSLFLLFVTNAGVELYELIADKSLPSLASSVAAAAAAGPNAVPSSLPPPKNKLKHVKTAAYPLVYHWILPGENILLLVDSKNVFQAYKLTSKQITKICKFELDCAGTSLTPPAGQNSFHRDQIVLTWLYGRMVILFINEAKGQLHLLSLAQSGVGAGGHGDEMEQTHVFDLYAPGKYDVSIIDNVLVVHSTQSKRSMLFDIRSESKTTIAEPLGIGPPLLAQAAAGTGASAAAGVSTVTFFDPASLRDGLAHSKPNPGLPSLAPASFHPYVKWTFLSPHFVWESTGDQQQGNLWTLHLNLQQIAHSWPQSKRARLVDFLLKRQSVQAKQLILQLLLQIVCTEPHSSLALLSRLFSLINRMNYDHRMNPHAAFVHPINLATLPLLPPFSNPPSAASTAPSSHMGSPAPNILGARPPSHSVSPYAGVTRVHHTRSGSSVSVGGMLLHPSAAGAGPSSSRLTSPAPSTKLGHSHHRSLSMSQSYNTLSPGQFTTTSGSSTAHTTATNTPVSAASNAAAAAGGVGGSWSTSASHPSPSHPLMAPLSYELDDSLSVLSCEMIDIPALQAQPLTVEMNLHGYMLISPLDLFLHVFERARSHIPVDQLIPVVVEYIRSAQRHFLKTEDVLNDLLVSLLLQAGRHYEFHQYLQYHILNDSLPIANRLISCAPVYPPAYQLGIDMLHRLGNLPRLLQVLLQHGQVLSALQLIPSYKAPFLSDTPGLYPRDFLQVACNTGDDLVFFHTYRFFESRNVALRASPAFTVGDGCEEFVYRYAQLFSESYATQAIQAAQAAQVTQAAQMAAMQAAQAAAVAAAAAAGKGAPAPPPVSVPPIPYVPPYKFFNLGDEDDGDGEDGDIEYEGDKPDPYAPSRSIDEDQSPARSRRSSSAAGAAAAAAASSGSGDVDAVAADDPIPLPSPLDLSTSIPSVGHDDSARDVEDAAAESGLGVTHKHAGHQRGKHADPEPSPEPPNLPQAGIDGSFGGMSSSSGAGGVGEGGHAPAPKRKSLFGSTPKFQAEPAIPSTPSAVRFVGGSGAGGAPWGGGGDEEATPDGIASRRPSEPAASPSHEPVQVAAAPAEEQADKLDGQDRKQDSSALGAADKDGDKEHGARGEEVEMAEHSHMGRSRMASLDEARNDEKGVRLHFGHEGDVALDVGESPAPRAGAGAAGGAHRAKSVPSHWHDSRISVEMHLALCIEDLMLLAPGANGGAQAAAPEANQRTDGSSLEQRAHAGSLDNSVVGQPSSTLAARPSGASAGDAPGQAALPVDFDEDAEPDITLEHVLAGVDYLLRTRIIGAALMPEDNKLIAEEEDDDQQEEGKENDETHGGVGDGSRMPAPLVAAPDSKLIPAVTHTLDGVTGGVPMPSAASSASHPYFSFVSLDLALCDDLVTALCYHMRRAEQKWSLRPKPSAEALKALQLFHDFFRFVYSFRVCVAARPVSYLAAALKVGRHLRSHDVAHRRLIVRVLLALEAECPRVERWEQLVEEPDDQNKVRAIAQGSADMKKFARVLKGHRTAVGAYDVEVSQSKRQSFHRSRGETDSKLDGGAPQSTLLQSLPAFYSTRHQTLLPPKGTFFDVEPARLLLMFRTNLETGLKSEEIEERQAMYGKNELPPPHEPSWLHMIWGQLKDFIILVLIAASVISMAVQDWKAAGVLLFVVLINVVIGLVQEHRSAQALKALSSFSVPQCQLLRDGEIKVAPASELVPGDLIQLDEGALVPADVRLVQVAQLSTIEAVLTGESLPILKSTPAIRPRHGSTQRRFLPVGDRINMAFMSTLVSKGRAMALVVNTGATTEVGRIYSALNSSSSNAAALTPLQRKLASLGKWLVLIALVSCGLVVAVGLGRGYGEDIVHIGISLAVSVIPEGLVTVVTLTMAVGVTRMAQQKAIVRNLPAVETLGSVSTICSDKTGTLTEGNMRTESMWTLGGAEGGADNQLRGNMLRFISAAKNPALAAVDPSAPKNASSSPVPAPAAVGSVSALLDERLTVQAASDLPVAMQWHSLVCGMNNNAVVKTQAVLQADGSTKEEETMVGDATEVALLRASQQAYCDVAYWESTFGLKRVLEYAFDSDRKRMSVVIALPAADPSQVFCGVRRPADATHILLCKGAPEAIVTRSVAHMSASAGPLELQPLNEQVESAIEASGSRMANKGMRVLATAFRFLSQAQVDEFMAVQAAAASEAADNAPPAADAAKAGKDASALASGSSEMSASDLSCSSAESQLCFVGLAGIMDPPRVEVAGAILRAQKAGIRVCMITGDHYDTALAIAKQIGIFSESRGDRAMNGDALAVLSEEQLAALDPFPVVFSRVSPDNKLKLVKSLQRRGEVVAMTGDGVNDSPAIRAADVGIAMGQGGTEVTRQASDIVLSDDNFATIVFAVEEGRRILDNIVKFLIYLLSCNGAEVAIMLTAVCAGWEVPYLPLMILWANIFVDIPPSLALGLEKVDAGAMSRRPRSNTAGILSPTVLAVMAFDAIVMALIVLLNYWHMIYVRHTDLGYARSFAFLLLAMIHLLHAWVSSSLTGTIFRRDLISNNPSMLWALLVATAFVLAGHYIPGLNDMLELEPIEGHEWGILVWNVGVFLAAVELRKLAMRVYTERKAVKEVAHANAVGTVPPPVRKDVDLMLENMTVQDERVGVPAKVQHNA